MTKASLQRFTARQVCWICHRQNVETGQRGPMAAHTACRKRIDHGEPVSSVRRDEQARA